MYSITTRVSYNYYYHRLYKMVLYFSDLIIHILSMITKVKLYFMDKIILLIFLQNCDMIKIMYMTLAD